MHAAASQTHDVVVLGCRVAAGGEVSGTFRLRLETALEAYLAHKALGLPSRIIVTGGDFSSSGVTEARAGADYLRREDRVPQGDLALEEKALDTVGNAVHTKRMLLESGCRTPTIVTSSYHLPRAAWIFAQVLGPEFSPAFVAAPAGLDAEEYRRRWGIESGKLAHAVKLFEELEIHPGEHEKLSGYLSARGRA